MPKLKNILQKLSDFENQFKAKLHALTDLSWDQRGDFLEILHDFRREDQGRDRLNMTQYLI